MTQTEQQQDTAGALAAANGGHEEAAPWTSAESRAQLVERTKGILLTPSAEWERIDNESATIAGIYFRHVIPLAAIPALASLIGSAVFGHSMLGFTYRPPLLQALISAVVQYGLTLAGVFVLALVIDWLAPKFEAMPNRVQAFKVAAYSATAAWVAGIFGLLPALSVLTILGFYSLYLLYKGLPRLMRAPQEKALSYTVVVVLVMLVAGFVIGALTAPITSLLGGRSESGPGSIAEAIGGADGETVSGSINIPGVGSLNLDEVENAARPKGELAGTLQNPVATPAKAVDPKLLAGLLPQTFAGLPATETENSSAGAAGIGQSRAKTRYGSGDTYVALEITDIAALGGLGAIAGAINIQSNRETATGYERTGNVDGRMTTEKWNSASMRGSYGTLVGNRFMIKAEGRGVDIERIKSAVRGLDFALLESAAQAEH